MDEGEAEAHTLGALIQSPPEVLRVYLTEINLRAEDFSSPFRSSVFQAIIELVDEGARPDVALLAAKLGPGSRVEIDEYAGFVPSIGNLRHYAEAVKTNARWRQIREAGTLLIRAADSKDPKLEEQADELLTKPQEGHQSTFTPGQLQELVAARLSEGEVPTIPLPLLGLNHLCGGLRRGEMVLLGGHTSFGKSLVLDAILSKGSDAGFKPHLYLNEMNALQRVDRFLAAESQIPFGRIRRGDLTPEQASQLLTAAGKIPFGITDAAGWSAEEIARHIRYHDFDLVGVDILHLIDHTEEKDLNRISRVLNQVAKLADVALVATVHLNRGRSLQAVRPRPVVTDIKGSSAFEQQADLVIFVHREQDSRGEPTEDGKGEIFIAKGRNTRLGGVEVYLDPNKMRFSESRWWM